VDVRDQIRSDQGLGYMPATVDAWDHNTHTRTRAQHAHTRATNVTHSRVPAVCARACSLERPINIVTQQEAKVMQQAYDMLSPSKNGGSLHSLSAEQLATYRKLTSRMHRFRVRGR